MTRFLVAGLAVITLALAVPSSADAVSASCLPMPLPATPLLPSYTVGLVHEDEIASMTLWRQPCTDGSGQIAALVRLTPISTAPSIFSGFVYVIQAGVQISGRFKLIPTAEQVGVSGPLLGPITLYLVEAAGASRPLDAAGAFTFIYDGSPATQLQVPAANAPPSPPSILVISTACNPCHSGQNVAFEMHVTNPGAPMLAEIRGGARFPDGSIVPLVNQETTLPSGASVLTLVPAQALPSGLLTIDLGIEAAILEPALGVTLSRHSVTLHLIP